jgi:hypothetical protein
VRPSPITPSVRTGSSTANTCPISSHGLADLVEIDGVDLAQQFELLPGDVARDADDQPRSGERMTLT